MAEEVTTGTPHSSPLLTKYGRYPQFIQPDIADDQLDSLAIVIQPDAGLQSAARRTAHKSQSLKIIELATTFVAVVCLWGALDDLVELLAGGSALLGIAYYVLLTAGAVVCQVVVNKLLNANINIVDGLHMF